MYYIYSITLLLMTLCCIEAQTNGGPRPIGGRVNPKPNATIQEVVICNSNIIRIFNYNIAI